MIEATTKQVGEHSFTYRPMTATPALKLFTRLTKTIGPAFAALAGASKDPTGALTLAAKALAENLGDDDAVAIVKTFAAQAEVDGKPLLPQFEIFFMDLRKVFSFVQFAVEAQYGSFSSVLPASLFASAKAVDPANATT